MRIATEFQRRAFPLLDQQMWCWGCDVQRAEGNLLLAYNAEKRPAPNPRDHSAYRFVADNHVVLNLWSWGIWVSQPQWGSLFIGRSRFRVHYSTEAIHTPDAWRTRDLPSMTGAHNEADAMHAIYLLEAALNWIGGYEDWLRSQVEPDYREQILEKWPQRKQHKGGTPAPEMSTRWFGLAKQITLHH
ncbi:MAG: hypothetical protein AAF125_20390 [Chloroflexota bacterium]